jgi:hypothetical protein
MSKFNKLSLADVEEEGFKPLRKVITIFRELDVEPMDNKNTNLLLYRHSNYIQLQHSSHKLSHPPSFSPPKSPPT